MVYAKLSFCYYLSEIKDNLEKAKPYISHGLASYIKKCTLYPTGSNLEIVDRSNRKTSKAKFAGIVK